jgi:flagellin-like hook-associated protein FlgL
MNSSLGGVTNNPTGSGAVLHGPALYSNTSIALNPGDTITFDWMAEGGSDAFDVFAYILDTQTGHTEQLLDTTGASQSFTQPWTTATHTVTTAGNYQYVFISGSWDATRGSVAGAQLYVDNINASSTTPDRIDISTVELASSALSAIDLGINAINASRANLGSYINRLAYAADNATNISSNATQSRSTIMDADYAIETTNLAKNQIIQQAATAMLAQANQHPQAVMTLLKNA